MQSSTSLSPAGKCYFLEDKSRNCTFQVQSCFCHLTALHYKLSPTPPRPFWPGAHQCFVWQGRAHRRHSPTEKPFPSSLIPQQCTSGRGTSASPAPVKFSSAGPPRGKRSSENEPQAWPFPRASHLEGLGCSQQAQSQTSHADVPGGCKAQITPGKRREGKHILSSWQVRGTSGLGWSLLIS